MIKTGVDFGNLDEMANDLWLFLTSDKRPAKATIKKESFIHEVKIIMDLTRQHHAKQQANYYDKWKIQNRWFTFENGFWYQKLEHPTAISDSVYNKHHRKTHEELYDLFIEQQTKLKKK